MSRPSLALIVAGCLAIGVGTVATSALRRSHDADIRLLFTGDILLSRQVQVEMDRTGRSPWDSLGRLFKNADWVAGNFEGAIGPSSECRASSSELCFAAPDSAVRLLTAAGFSAVSIENNHAGDLGAGGRAHTRETLRAAGLLGIDFDQSPRFVRFGDVTIGVVAVTLERAADGQVQAIPSVALAQKLRLARTLANVVVVSIHWGNELQDWPSAEQRAAAEWLIDHGADVIVGHDPHVIQAPDCVHGRPVFFSLGNHVFDQRYPETKEGLIADCTIRGRRVRCGAMKTHARRGSAAPVAMGTEATVLDRCTVPVGKALRIDGYELRPVAWSTSAADSAGETVLEAWKDGRRQWRTRRVSLVALQPGLATDGSKTLLFALERHGSPMDGEVALRPHVYDVSDRGLIARWRGTALAWPLVDAVVERNGEICALHRGDSFVRLDTSAAALRVMRYRWNGFGFSAVAGACSR